MLADIEHDACALFLIVDSEGRGIALVLVFFQVENESQEDCLFSRGKGEDRFLCGCDATLFACDELAHLRALSGWLSARL